MEFHVSKPGGPGKPDRTDHIMTTNSRGQDDQSPLQLISAELLEHYQRCEAELLALKTGREFQTTV